MSDIETFAWAAWRRRFGIGTEYLADVWKFYPEILPLMRETAERPAATEEQEVLPDAFVQALLFAAQLGHRSDASFEAYLEQGELDAASVLLERAAAAMNMPAMSLQRQLGQKQQELEAEFAASRARLLALHSILENLGILRLEDPDVTHARDTADQLFGGKRLGPANAVLQKAVTRLEAQVQVAREQLTSEMQALRGAAELETAEDQRISLIRRIERAEAYLAQDQLSLARSELELVRAQYETHDITPQLASDGKESPILSFRGRFPYLTAQDLHSYITDPDGTTTIVSTQWIKEFNAQWRPSHWKSGKPPAPQDEILQVLNALRTASGRKSRLPTAPFGGGDRDYWGTFLPRFLRILGKAGFEPEEAEPILPSKHDSSGYWLARCKPDLTIPFSFVTPERLRNGLAIIIWNRPESAACPTPANLAEELRRRGISDEPLVVLAAREIPNDDDKRAALRSAVPTAALLDEQDLLKIIFASDSPEGRAAHFVRGIAWQLPTELVSPYSSAGDVPSSMFVGRDPILRDFLNPSGSSVLYGGRKLGKSSIFRQLQHRFEQQDGGTGTHIAIYVHAIDVVDDVSITRRLLPRIAAEINSRLKRTLDPARYRNLALPEEAPTRSSYFDAFVGAMDQLLHNLPEYRVLLLIDEADLLLQHLNVPNLAQTSPTQQLGWTLRRWIQDTQGRFDVRFAGFQEISRVSQYASGPFFNFGRGGWQHQLSVLEPAEARDLIVYPLSLLGVKLKEPSSVDLIIDFAGRHPALIQEFCSRLYNRVRGATRKQHYAVDRNQVLAVWQDREFRKSVVLAIHLNVDTRRTKPEKILRLLLYVWVRQMMGGTTTYRLPTVAEPGDLYTLLTLTFTPAQVEAHVQPAELDSYLADLAALGVLTKRGRGYVFHYRYFATLLFYDHFGGHLTEAVVDEVWQSIFTHREEPPRWQITVGDELALSPFTRLDQAHLETETEYVPLVMGAPGTGKSEFFAWLQDSHEQQGQHSLDIRIIQAPATLPELRNALAEVLKFGGATSWQMFAEHGLHWRKRSRPVVVVIDDVDHLVATDDQLVAADWSLISWPDEQDRVHGDDGLIFTLARIMRATKGELRFILSGSFPLSRLWFEAEALLSETATPIVTKRLSVAERDAWFGTVQHLGATSDVKQGVWDVTGGSFRLLRALRTWLRRQQINELREEHLTQFKALLDRGCDPERLPELCQSLDKYDSWARTTLRYLATLAQDLGSDEADEMMWAELLLMHAQLEGTNGYDEWTVQRWFVGLRTAALFQDIQVRQEERDGEPRRVIVPMDDALFQLVVTSHD